MKILLYIIVSLVIVLLTNIVTKYLYKYLYESLIEVNDSGLETTAYEITSNTFIVSRICFFIVGFLYVMIIYVSKVYEYNYQVFLVLVILYIYIKYKIVIGGCKLIEHLYVIKFEFSKLTQQEWEIMYLLGSIRVYKGKFWVIWEPSKNKIQIKR